jgi:hypothetical protein
MLKPKVMRMDGLEQSRRANQKRRKDNPTWPSHKSTTYFPDGHREVVETMPVGKLQDHVGYCKYCYQQHRNWWMMDQNDFLVEGLTIILCGECGYTIAKEFT